MPNIKQQGKRVRQAARQRNENLRWRSTAKTLMRRLREAAGEGDATALGERHRELVSWLDKAAARGMLTRTPPPAARRRPHESCAAEKLRFSAGRCCAPQSGRRLSRRPLT
ncbi:MAG TPA: 30S ribosomal protein S20 [Gaiellaceae bacterium]|nr:30S ribosomal protein S20 [Gaiellaceae bacterium]